MTIWPIVFPPPLKRWLRFHPPARRRFAASSAKSLRTASAKSAPPRTHKKIALRGPCCDLAGSGAEGFIEGGRFFSSAELFAPPSPFSGSRFRSFSLLHAGLPGSRAGANAFFRALVNFMGRARCVLAHRLCEHLNIFC